MSLLLSLTTVALAGWTPNGTDHGCTFYLGTANGSVQPVRAECDWPLPPEKVHRFVAATADHDLYFSSVEACDVLGPAPGGGQRVRQVHVATGMSAREATLVFTTEAIPNGTRYAWSLAPRQEPTSRVPVATDSGMWEITRGTGGGTHVVYELFYDPGGSVPGFLVRWFQGPGVKTLVGELRRWIETH